MYMSWLCTFAENWVSFLSLKAHLQSPYRTRNRTRSSVPWIQKEDSDSLLHTASDKGMRKKIVKLRRPLILKQHISSRIDFSLGEYSFSTLSI